MKIDCSIEIYRSPKSCTCSRCSSIVVKFAQIDSSSFTHANFQIFTVGADSRAIYFICANAKRLFYAHYTKTKWNETKRDVGHLCRKWAILMSLKLPVRIVITFLPLIISANRLRSVVLCRIENRHHGNESHRLGIRLVVSMIIKIPLILVF